jgi:hypothetical protein
MIHHSYLPALDTHGISALLALLNLIENPPQSLPSSTEIFKALLCPFRPRDTLPTLPIRNAEILGHGLGGVIALLVSTALHLELTGPAAKSYSKPLTPLHIRTTSFSAPRIGDSAFAQWIDDLTSQSDYITSQSSASFRVHRITSYGDAMTHLPEKHLGLSHPTKGEIWIGADPRVAYACEGEGECSQGIELGRTNMLDHAGPFGGIWIGRGRCGKTRREAL